MPAAFQRRLWSGDVLRRCAGRGRLDGLVDGPVEPRDEVGLEVAEQVAGRAVALGGVGVDGAGILDEASQPVSRWWPVAYSLQRLNDAKAGSALLTLLQGDGAMTRAFAARGLGAIKEPRAIAPLVAVVAKADEATAVRIQAARALGALRASQAIEPLTKLLSAATTDPNLRLEALTALGNGGFAAGWTSSADRYAVTITPFDI